MKFGQIFFELMIGNPLAFIAQKYKKCKISNFG